MRINLKIKIKKTKNKRNYFFSFIKMNNLFDNNENINFIKKYFDTKTNYHIREYKGFGK